MQDNRQTPALGPLAVTASGGVGALALSIFSRAGYTVHAVSGKPDQADFLRSIGATEVLPREALADTAALQSARFGGAWTMRAARCWPACWRRRCPMAACAGLAASPALDMTVMPFILRGVSLLGVSSACTAQPARGRGRGWETSGNRSTWTASAPPKWAWIRRRCSSGCCPVALGRTVVRID